MVITHNTSHLVLTITLSKDNWGHVTAYGTSCSFDATCTKFFDFYTDNPDIQEFTSQDDGSSTPDDNGRGNTPIYGPKHTEDCYLETIHFNLKAIKNTHDDHINLVSKTSSFVYNITTKFWNELRRIALKNEIGDKIKQELAEYLPQKNNWVFGLKKVIAKI